jgi:hypothetical protein
MRHVKWHLARTSLSAASRLCADTAGKVYGLTVCMPQARSPAVHKACAVVQPHTPWRAFHTRLQAMTCVSVRHRCHLHMCWVPAAQGYAFNFGMLWVANSTYPLERMMEMLEAGYASYSDPLKWLLGTRNIPVPPVNRQGEWQDRPRLPACHVVGVSCVQAPGICAWYRIGPSQAHACIQDSCLCSPLSRHMQPGCAVQGRWLRCASWHVGTTWLRKKPPTRQPARLSSCCRRTPGQAAARSLRGCAP